ncbi:MAG: hypothetical protein ABJQ34_21250 [Paracoccaceae bacterium]
MRRLLISKNHIAAGDPRPNTRLTVKAEVITRVQKDIASLVGIGEMRKSMNVTVSQFKALVDGGLIKPARHAVSQRQPWDPKDGQQLLVRLLVDAWDLKSGNLT